MKKKLLVLTSLFASTAMLGACGNLGKATSGGGASGRYLKEKGVSDDGPDRYGLLSGHYQRWPVSYEQGPRSRRLSKFR